MTIRKAFMSMVPLSSLVVLALAAVPATADEKVTIEGVTLWTKFQGTLDHGFSLKADYRGADNKDKTCGITVTMTLKDGTKKTFEEFNFTVSPRDIVQDFGDREVGMDLAPLTNPELKGHCGTAH